MKMNEVVYESQKAFFSRTQWHYMYIKKYGNLLIFGIGAAAHTNLSYLHVGTKQTTGGLT